MTRKMRPKKEKKKKKKCKDANDLGEKKEGWEVRIRENIGKGVITCVRRRSPLVCRF